MVDLLEYDEKRAAKFGDLLVAPHFDSKELAAQSVICICFSDRRRCPNSMKPGGKCDAVTQYEQLIKAKTTPAIASDAG